MRNHRKNSISLNLHHLPLYVYLYVYYIFYIYLCKSNPPTPRCSKCGKAFGKGRVPEFGPCKLVSMKVPSLAISRCFRPSVCWFFFRSCYRDFSAFNGEEVSSSILLLLRLPESCCLWVFPAVRLFAFCAFSVATMWAVPRKVFRRSKVTFIGCRKIASSQPLVAFSFLA